MEFIDGEQLTVFAEQYYCRYCKTNPCEIFTSGKYETCPGLLAEFQKQENEYNDFLASIQKPFVPGKCLLCRNEEMNDRDNNYTLTTLRNPNGTIKMRAYLCSYHYQKEVQP